MKARGLKQLVLGEGDNALLSCMGHSKIGLHKCSRVRHALLLQVGKKREELW